MPAIVLAYVCTCGVCIRFMYGFVSVLRHPRIDVPLHTVPPAIHQMAKLQNSMNEIQRP